MTIKRLFPSAPHGATAHADSRISRLTCFRLRQIHVRRHPRAHVITSAHGGAFRFLRYYLRLRRGRRIIFAKKRFIRVTWRKESEISNSSSPTEWCTASFPENVAVEIFILTWNKNHAAFVIQTNAIVWSYLLLIFWVNTTEDIILSDYWIIVLRPIYWPMVIEPIAHLCERSRINGLWANWKLASAS